MSHYWFWESDIKIVLKFTYTEVFESIIVNKAIMYFNFVT